MTNPSRTAKELVTALAVAGLAAAALFAAATRAPRPSGVLPAPYGAKARGHIDQPVDESKQKEDPEELARRMREFEADQKRRANQPELVPPPPGADLGAIPVEPQHPQ